jgi:hypothetical protein
MVVNKLRWDHLAIFRITSSTDRNYFSPAGMTGIVAFGPAKVALLSPAVGMGQTVRRWLRWTSAGLDGSLRWKETEQPLGSESVSGRLLPGGLALPDPGNWLSGPTAEMQIENTKTVLTFVFPKTENQA